MQGFIRSVWNREEGRAIDTVMMKYRRHGPDDREDQGGWVDTWDQGFFPLGMQLQASVMRCAMVGVHST